MQPPGVSLMRMFATRRALFALLFIVFSAVANAYDARVSQDDGLLQTCSGMWAGKNTSISLLFTAANSDAKVAIIMYEWSDFLRIGARLPDPNAELNPNGTAPTTKWAGKEYLCTPTAVARQLCPPEQVGNWIAPSDGTFSKRIIQVSPQHIPEPMHYAVNKTGYYCVGAASMARADGNPAEAEADMDAPFAGVVHFENAFEGTMPAAEYPKVGLYFWLTVVYALMAAGWGYLCFTHRTELLPIQHMITAILAFLVVDMAIQWAYMHYQNAHNIDYWHMRALYPGNPGVTAALRALLAITSFMDAAKTTLSLFLLLVVSLGYGVVRPTLGPVMRRVQLLAAAHFIFGILYAIGVLMLLTEVSAAWPIMFIMPLAVTLAAFMLWILHALTTTISTLERRHQTFKQQIFTNLHRLLMGIAVSIMLFFITVGVLFGQVGNDFGPGTWKYRWFMLDGWLSIVYLAGFSGVAYLWRPTGQNLRLSMSDEVAMDDTGVQDEFEIDEFAQSGDRDEEEETRLQHSGFLGGLFGTLHQAAAQQAGFNNPRARASRDQPTSSDNPAPARPSHEAPHPANKGPKPSSAVLHDSGEAFTIGDGDDEDSEATPKLHHASTEDDNATIRVPMERQYESGTAAERKGLVNSSEDEDDSFSDVGKDFGPPDSKKAD